MAKKINLEIGVNTQNSERKINKITGAFEQLLQKTVKVQSKATGAFQIFLKKTEAGQKTVVDYFKKMKDIGPKVFKAIGYAAVGAAAAITGVVLGLKQLFEEQSKDQSTKKLVNDKLAYERLIQFITDAGLNSEQAQQSINAMFNAFKNTGGAERAFKIISDIAAETGNLSNMTKFADLFSDIASKRVISFSEFEQFNKILGKSAVQMEDLKTVTGKSIQTIEKELEKGKFSSLDLIKGIEAAQLRLGNTKVAGDLAKNLAPTSIEAQLNRLESLFERVRKTIFKSIFGDDETAAKNLKKIGDAIQEILDKKQIEKFFQNLNDKLKWIEDHGPVIQAILYGIGGALLIAFGPAIVTALGAFAVAAWTAVAPFLPLIIVIGLLSAAIALLIYYWDDIISYFKKLPDEISYLWSELSKFADNLYNEFMGIASNIINGIVEGLKNGKDYVIRTLTGIIQAGINGVYDLLKINSPSLVFEGIADYTVEGFNKGLIGGATSVEQNSRLLAQSSKEGMQDEMGNINSVVDYFNKQQQREQANKIGVAQTITNNNNKTSITNATPINVNISITGGTSVTKEDVKEMLDPSVITNAVQDVLGRIAIRR